MPGHDQPTSGAGDPMALEAPYAAAIAVAGDLARRLAATPTFVHAGDEQETADHIAHLVRSGLPTGRRAPSRSFRASTALHNRAGCRS